jgi:hypothetical protein
VSCGDISVAVSFLLCLYSFVSWVNNDVIRASDIYFSRETGKIELPYSEKAVIASTAFLILDSGCKLLKKNN